MRAHPNSRYARRNPFGAGFDAGGGVQSNVGAGGAGSYQPPAQQGWSGTSQGFGGGGKGSGYGMGKGMGGGGMMQGQNQNYGPGFGQQQGQGFSVPWGYFNQAQQYNPMLYAGLSNIGMQSRPWQYGNSMPLFQSGNTFNQYRPPQPQQPQSGGGGGFSVLPNFDQNGQIISIPQGVTWGTPSGGGEPNWLYNGSHTTQNQIPGFGDPSAGTPLSQYTGAAPWGSGAQPASNTAGYTQLPSGQYMPGNNTGPFTMAARGGAIKKKDDGMDPRVLGIIDAMSGETGKIEGLPSPYAGSTPHEEMEHRRDAIDAGTPLQEWAPMNEPQWVPSDEPTGDMENGQWMKLQL